MKISSFILFLSLSCPLYSQVNPVFLGSLPSLINEASGLECPHPDTCWTHNDTNDAEHVYLIDGIGNFLGQRVLQNANQIDFEDLALAGDGRLFVGDFGNNDNDREDLSIYICSPSTSSGSLIPTERIDFILEDQEDFPPVNAEKNFDIESMIYHDGFIYLLTRNRSTPFNGICKMYRLDASSGSQTALVSDEFFGNLSPDYSSITSADISPGGSRLALLTHSSLFLFHDLDNWPLISGQPSYNFFSFSRNFEGISFIDDCTVYLVSESTASLPGELYSLNTCDIVTSLNDESMDRAIQFRNGNIYVDPSVGSSISFRLFDIQGKEHSFQRKMDYLLLPTSLSDGIYILSYTDGSRIGQFKFIYRH